MIGRGVAVAASLVALAAATSPTAQAQTSTAVIVPTLDCVRISPTRLEVTGVFGYWNTGSTATDVAISANNVFTPPPGFRGQPTTFQPGRQQAAFTVTFRTDVTPTITWSLQGRALTVDPATAPRCAGYDGTFTDAAIIGTPVVGQRLAARVPTLDGGHAPYFSYRWQRCATVDESSCVDIPGADAPGYVPTTGDAGSRLRVRTVGVSPFSASAFLDGRPTAFDGPFTRTSDSAISAPVAARPAVSALPELTGSTEPGSTLTVVGATFTGDGLGTPTRTIERCGPSSCTAVQTGGTGYTVVEADRETTLRVVEEVAGVDGITARAVSAARAVPAAPAPPTTVTAPPTTVTQTVTAPPTTVTVPGPTVGGQGAPTTPCTQTCSPAITTLRRTATALRSTVLVPARATVVLRVLVAGRPLPLAAGSRVGPVRVRRTTTQVRLRATPGPLDVALRVRAPRGAVLEVSAARGAESVTVRRR
ncbi:hypothetical protein [Paraconexibacter algicola]|uniref:IPT/TIG domain-containing protein n=1 Tax=Paraconexibacter algicola TaxID=2133960 RepID=A0A2T4UJC5_9ACTN|nr:hypothetical protein [Paraconexibacter algicola]PTL59344.1 hypothetical protein C7Y72_06600 [Paraconexibacter algicola]